MKILEYVRIKGIETILNLCGYNLKNVKNHLKRELNITQNKKMDYALNLFRAYLKNMPQNKNKQETYISELLDKIGENNNDNISKH